MATVNEFITKEATKRGLEVAGIRSRIVGGLAIAGIRPEAQLTAVARNSVSAILDRLERKLGKSARVVAEEPAPAPARRSVKTPVPDSKRLRKRPVDVATEDFDPKETQSYANALRRGEDPATGAKLSSIELMPGVKALHNASTRVVYPIPGNASLPERV